MAVIKKKLSESLEDYLEAIFNLTAEREVARSRDIAESLCVSRASVTGALKLLSEKDLINYKPYGFVTLTEKGKKRAYDVVQRHNILEMFFINVLGVEKTAAKKAACKAEHVLGRQIIEKLLNFTEFSLNYPDGQENIAEKFQQFCSRRGI